MSRLIKPGTGTTFSGVQPLARSSWSPPKTPEALEKERQRARIVELEAALKDRDAAMAGLKEEAEKRVRESYEKGYSEGLADAESKEAQRLEKLSDAVERAAAEIQGGFDEMQRVAILLARECLEMMLGLGNELDTIVPGLIRKQLEQIERKSLLRVEVSPEDFKDQSALESLCASLGLDKKSVVARAGLDSGECTMVLRLGQIDIGLRQQWGALRLKLDQMAEQEVAC